MQDLLPIQQPNFSDIELKDKAVEILNGLDVSEGTRRDYVKRIGFFLDYITSNGFDRDTFISFKRDLATRNDISVSTKSIRLTVARVFLRELHRQGIIPVDITVNVKSFKQGKKHKRFGVTEEEVKRILHELEQLPSNCPNRKMKVIFSLLIFQGLRQVECTRLDCIDINLQQSSAMIKGKGQDDKDMINLHPYTVKSIKEYCDECKIKDGALLVSHSNNNRNGRMTTKCLREIVKGFLKKLNIENRSTHGFRHFYTTKMISLFASDLLTVQKFTRHRSVETLQIYNDNLSLKDNLPTFYDGFDFSDNS